MQMAEQLLINKKVFVDETSLLQLDMKATRIQIGATLLAESGMIHYLFNLILNLYCS